jgi:hypothetical membrane protein
VLTARRKLGVAAVLWVMAALIFVLLEGLAAAAVVPSYSYLYGFISDLGVPAWSPRAALMNAAFWVQGLMFLAGAVLIARARRGGGLFVFLAGMNAVGNILVAVVHGGSALFANGYAWMHVLGALLAIVGGNAAILAGSSVVAKAVVLRGYRAASVAIAVVGFISLVITTIATSNAATVMAVGAWERGSVYSILAWQVFTGVVLLARRPALDLLRQRHVHVEHPGV